MIYVCIYIPPPPISLVHPYSFSSPLVTMAKRIKKNRLVVKTLLLLTLQVVTIVLLWTVPASYGFEFVKEELIAETQQLNSVEIKPNGKIRHDRTSVICSSVDPMVYHICRRTLHFFDDSPPSESILDVYAKACVAPALGPGLAQKLLGNGHIIEESQHLPRLNRGILEATIDFCKGLQEVYSDTNQFYGTMYWYTFFMICWMCVVLSFTTKLMPKSTIPWVAGIILAIMSFINSVMICLKGRSLAYSTSALVPTGAYPNFIGSSIQTMVNSTDEVLRNWLNEELQAGRINTMSAAFNLSSALVSKSIRINNLGPIIAVIFTTICFIYHIAFIPMKAPVITTLNPPTPEDGAWQYVPTLLTDLDQNNDHEVVAEVSRSSEEGPLMKDAEDWLEENALSFMTRTFAETKNE